ncbi:hypothetical protein [Jiella mangrovi]|uniref:Phage gp6-like head-tail connector protein n=1 Tax=Jiella mangrovi TaxID=2821407 RepID=A0ABS4BE94_9HYPH|nr:hypothetical protein [Jiella mangrovi]MBP0614285.1 hypothetical protein [Jiella mangrovi]
MAVTVRRSEGTPDSYPDAPAGLSAAAAALDATMIWQRMEAYVAHRFGVRDIEWIVEGSGEWSPPLTPATISTIEVWDDGEWIDALVSPSPFGGYVLPGCGPYRFTGTVGTDAVPAVVSEAFRRLAEYMAAKPGKAGAASESVTAGSITLTHRRSPSWLASAVQNSGAGDLLRPYRRA